MKQSFPLPSLSKHAELVDTHCHLDMPPYRADLDEVIRSAAAQGIRRILTIGIDEDSSRAAVALAERYPGHLFATIGFHPHDARDVSHDALRSLAELASRSAVVGYGEIGLDYVKNYAPREVQRRVFIDQLHLAKDLDLPIVIHDREAHDDVYSLLKEHGPFPKGGVMHCFSGDRYLAEAMIDLGFYISIPGVVTFANAHTLHEVVRVADIDRLLLETDGPYLAPVPFRGKRNEPRFILYTAQKVAALKNLSLEEVARATTANAIRLFSLAGELDDQ